MVKTVRAVFDGQVLRPESPVDLIPQTTYVLTITSEEALASANGEEEYPLTKIGALATDMGVTDLSARHSWYARGGPEDEHSGSRP